MSTDATVNVPSASSLTSTEHQVMQTPSKTGSYARGLATLMVACAWLANCTATAPAPIEPSSFAAAVEFPDHTCSKYGLPNGGSARLTAERVTPGDPAYIEFRQRPSPAIPSGHMFVVFGRLDPQGKPVTRQYIGLYPKGLVVGLYGGAIVPMPAELHPSLGDCKFGTAAAYRVSLNEAQYRRLLAEVRSIVAKPPLWHMLGFNCNHFAARLGSVVGLRPPQNNLLPSFAYIHAFIRANEGAPTSGA